MFGIKFSTHYGSKHSYDDWGLILKERPEITSPDPKTLYDDIPMSDGALDLTTSLTGFVAYDMRSIKMTFNVIHARERWTSLKSEIMNFLHGLTATIYLDEDPEYYYEGRLNFDEWKSSKRTSTLVISGLVYPYKKSPISTVDDWMWDNFNFETGAIRDYKDMPVSATQKFYPILSRMPVVPVFTVETDDGQGFTLGVKASENLIGYAYYKLEDGVNQFPALCLDDRNPWEFCFMVPRNFVNGIPQGGAIGEGIGTVSIYYQIGSL